MSEQEKVIRVEGLPMGAGFNWSVGVLMETFIKSLADKKLLGAKCPKCGYVITPPRTRCARCNAKLGKEELIELPGKGKLLSLTVAKVKLDGKCKFVDLEEPVVIGAVRLEGADSTLFMPIDADPETLEIGSDVVVQWAKTTKGEIADIKGFKPV